jgi:hypothetical protein
MEEDFYVICLLCDTEFHCGDDVDVSPTLAYGVDNVEVGYGDLPWRSRLSVFDNTGTDMAGEEVLSECLEVSETWICHHVS